MFSIINCPKHTMAAASHLEEGDMIAYQTPMGEWQLGQIDWVEKRYDQVTVAMVERKDPLWFKPNFMVRVILAQEFGAPNPVTHPVQARRLNGVPKVERPDDVTEAEWLALPVLGGCWFVTAPHKREGNRGYSESVYRNGFEVAYGLSEGSAQEMCDRLNS